MGGELVTVASPPPEGRKLSDVLVEQEAQYLAMGMTFEQYWDGDATAARAYRRAHELKRKLINEEAWLHGLYIYDAIGCMAPILNMNAKRGTKPRKYPEPYKFDDRGIPKTEEQIASAEEAAYVGMQSKMNAFMLGFNKQLSEKKGDDSNGRE